MNKDQIDAHEHNMEELSYQQRIGRGQDAINSGEHLYYVVRENTNMRLMDGTGRNPVIYMNLEAAQEAAHNQGSVVRHDPMSVYEYDDMFRRFMIEEPNYD